MKNIKLGLVAILWLFLSATTSAQSNKDVIRAFMKIDAQTEIGVNNRDYGALLGEANLELQIYAKSKEGIRHPEVMRMLSDSLAEYQLADILWQNEINGSDFLYPSQALYQSIERSYPEALKSVDEGGAMSTYNQNLSVHFLIPVIWARAAGKAKSAMGLL